jgi:hypothetical protein
MHGGWRKKLQMQPFFYKGMQGAVDEKKDERQREIHREKKKSSVEKKKGSQ